MRPPIGTTEAVPFRVKLAPDGGGEVRKLVGVRQAREKAVRGTLGWIRVHPGIQI